MSSGRADPPTPLLLRYGPGDWNALHRDLYGELMFPLQVVIGLDWPEGDYTGGEFLAVEQRPRAQSRGTTTAIGQGQALVFTTRERPCPPAGAGRPRRCVTASACCAPAAAMRWASSSMMPDDSLGAHDPDARCRPAAVRGDRGRAWPRGELRVCRALLGPADAADAWSETFLSALEAYPKLRSESSIRAWL